MASSTPSIPSPAYLHVSGTNTPIELPSYYHFGRNEVFPHPSLNASHFTIARNSQGEHFIMDQDSKTGTLVNGVAITPKKWILLAEGSQIACGPYVLTLWFSATIPEPATPPIPKRPPSLWETLSKSLIEKLPLTAHEPYQPDPKTDKVFLLSLASLNIATFFALLFTHGSRIMKIDREALIRFGGDLPYLTTGGESWRLFSATFLHGNLLHMMGNTLALYFVASHLIRFMPPTKIFITYLSSAFIAHVFSTLLAPTNVLTFGSSEAIFGLYAALCVHLVVHRHREVSVDRYLIAASLPFFVINLIVGINPFSFFSNIVGFIIGGTLAWIYLKMIPENDKVNAGKLFSAFTAIVILIALVLPVRKLTSSMQMEPFFSQYYRMLDSYYDNFRLAQKEKNFPAFLVKQQNFMKSFTELEKKLKKTQPVDRQAIVYRDQILELVRRTRDHHYFISEFVRTGKNQYYKSAQKEETEMLNSMIQFRGQMRNQSGRIPASIPSTARKR